MISGCGRRSTVIRLAGGDALVRPLAVHEPPDLERVRVAEFGREEGLGDVLVTDRAAPAGDRKGANGGGVRLVRRGVRPAVDHGWADFDARGDAVEDETPHVLLEDRLEAACEFFIGRGGPDGARKTALDSRGGIGELFGSVAEDEEDRGAEDLLVQRRGLAESVEGGLEQDRR